MSENIVYKNRPCGGHMSSHDKWSMDELIAEAKLYGIDITLPEDQICKSLIHAQTQRREQIQKERQQEYEMITKQIEEVGIASKIEQQRLMEEYKHFDVAAERAKILPRVKELSQYVKIFNYDEQRFTDLKKIGEGGFGDIYTVYDNRKHSTICFKQIRSNLQSKQTAKIQIFREILILKTLKQICDQHVVCYIGTYLKKDGTLYIAMEFLGQYEPIHILMHRYVFNQKDNKGNYLFNMGAKTLFIELIRGMVVGMKQIHDLGIAHRDIKPNNIMANQAGNVKYIDFGNACDRAITCQYHTGDATTYEFMPPILVGKDVFEQYQNWDYWSMGMTIMYMISPFITPTNGFLKKFSDNFTDATKFFTIVPVELRTVNFAKFVCSLMDGHVARMDLLDKIFDDPVDLGDVSTLNSVIN